MSFQVTLLQVADLQWDAAGPVLGLMAWNSGLSLAPSSRPACGVLTIDTGFRRLSVQRLMPGQCRQDFGGVAGQERCDGQAEAGKDTAVIEGTGAI